MVLKMYDKTLLIIASSFPPVNTSGVIRIGKFAKYLMRMGWNVSALTRIILPSVLIDQDLSTEVTGTKVYRTSQIDFLKPWKKIKEIFFKDANSRKVNSEQSFSKNRNLLILIKDYVSYFFALPDSCSGWIFPAVLRGLQIIKKEKINILLSSAPYFSSHLIALLLKKITRKPWVADFRDPWIVDDPNFRGIPYKSLNQLNARLESYVVSNADRVIANTEALRSNFIRRYPELARDKFLLIPNGFDPEDFENLQISGKRKDKLIISHIGSIYWKRNPLPFLKAIKNFITENTSCNRQLEIRFIGFVEKEHEEALRKFLSEAQLTNLVKLIKAVPRQKALEYLYESDILLVFGFDGPGCELQVPAKLFEYLKAGRSIFALAPENTAIVETLESAKASYFRANPSDVKGIYGRFQDIYLQFKNKQDFSSPSNIEIYNRKKQAKQLGQILEDILNLRKEINS